MGTGASMNVNVSMAEAGNSTTFLEEAEVYEVPTAIVVLLSVVYGSISLVATVGNCLVIWIIAKSRRLQNVTNYYIANLASADIIIGVFAIPFQFQAALLQRWNLPAFMCGFCPFVQVLSVNVSVFTLTAIAVDRYRAIFRPLSCRSSKMTAKIALVGIWLLGAALAVPIATALRVIFIKDASGNFLKPYCYNTGLSRTSMMIYSHVLVSFQYIMPLVVISVAYGRMARKLWGSKTPGNAEDNRDATLMKNKKKVIKMLAIVVSLFGICWLPLQTYNFFQEIFPQINDFKYINIIWFCFHLLAMSNSCYNPFIYAIYNENFQRELNLRLRRCCLPKKYSSPITEFSDVIQRSRAGTATAPSYRGNHQHLRYVTSYRETGPVQGSRKSRFWKPPAEYREHTYL